MGVRFNHYRIETDMNTSAAIIIAAATRESQNQYNAGKVMHAACIACIGSPSACHPTAQDVSGEGTSIDTLVYCPDCDRFAYSGGR